MIRTAFALCLLSAFAASAQAQDTAVPPGTIALTPDQREAALEAGAVRARDESLQNGANDRRVHGEMGVEVGSRGERAAYGTMVAPIGQNAVAAISYSTGQGPRWHNGGRFHSSSVGGEISNGAPANAAPSAAGAEDDPD